MYLCSVYPLETELYTSITGGLNSITRSNSLSMQLGNKTGLISLYDRESKIVANVRYSRADSGQIICFERTNSEE